MRAAAAAPALALMTGAAEAKMAQAAVKYQTDPKDGHQCDGCNFFVAPNGCKMVDGDIVADRLVRPLGQEGRLTRNGGGRVPADARRQATVRVQPRRPSRASASISTFISGLRSAATTTIVAAGRMSPKTSPCTFSTGLAIGGVGDEGPQPHDVGERPARLVQHRREGRVDVAGLLGRIVRHRHARVIVAGRAGDQDLVADDDRARIAVSSLERRAGRDEAASARSLTRTP